MTLTEPCFPPDRPPHNYPNPTFSLIVASSFDKHVIIRRADMWRVCREARETTRSHIRANWRRQPSSGWRFGPGTMKLPYANLTAVSNWDHQQIDHRRYLILICICDNHFFFYAAVMQFLTRIILYSLHTTNVFG